MMFRNDLVGVIVNKGKIMRESRNHLGESVVKLPFGSEYSVRLKNLNTVKAVVSVEIDGSSAADGLIIEPGTSFELKGFLEGLRVRNRFRFIKKTKQISDYRGDRIDDGIVRICYRFEKIYYVPWSAPKRIKQYPDYLDPSPWTYYTYSSTDAYGSNMNMVEKSSGNVRSAVTEDGITVKGSETKQDFVYGQTNDLEEHAHVINIKLVGYSDQGVVVTKPVTTKTKIRCKTCGRRYTSRYKFCPNCSTYLS